jgi:hypothetical protein
MRVYNPMLITSDYRIPTYPGDYTVNGQLETWNAPSPSTPVLRWYNLTAAAYQNITFTNAATFRTNTTGDSNFRILSMDCSDNGKYIAMNVRDNPGGGASVYSSNSPGNWASAYGKVYLLNTQSGDCKLISLKPTDSTTCVATQTNSDTYGYHHVGISPNGTYVVFAGCQASTPTTGPINQLYLYNTANATVTALSTGITPVFPPGIGNVRVRNDGLVFFRAQVAGLNFNWYRTAGAGSSTINPSPGGGITTSHSGSLSPSGRYLAYCTQSIVQPGIHVWDTTLDVDIWVRDAAGATIGGYDWGSGIISDLFWRSENPITVGWYDQGYTGGNPVAGIFGIFTKSPGFSATLVETVNLTTIGDFGTYNYAIRNSNSAIATTAGNGMFGAFTSDMKVAAYSIIGPSTNDLLTQPRNVKSKIWIKVF